MININNAEKLKIINDFKQRLSIICLSKKYKHSHNIISELLISEFGLNFYKKLVKENYITRNLTSRRVDISKKERFQIINDFTEKGISVLKISKKYHHSSKTITNFLINKLGIDKYKEYVKIHKRKTFLDLNKQKRIKISKEERNGIINDFEDLDVDINTLLKKYHHRFATIKIILIKEFGKSKYNELMHFHRGNSRPDSIGNLNPNWKGGLSFEPYCFLFNKDFKERVREFWNRKCAKCGKTEIENGRKLCVHHVDYNKDSCCDNAIPLFIPLCNNCHTKTNSNRNYWRKYFIDLIYKQDKSGKCFYSKEEMEKLKIV